VSRVPLPVVQARPEPVSCTSCGRCCTYVGVGINSPSRPRYATDILWYLYHENVSVYRDGDGEWSVHFESRCRNLGADLLCGVYPTRPHICRTFDDRTCEVNDPAAGARTFREPREFLDWLSEHRPRVHATIARTHVPQPLRPLRAELCVRGRAVARKARSKR
jgi:Fe-S-cluster containining protein